MTIIRESKFSLQYIMETGQKPEIAGAFSRFMAKCFGDFIADRCPRCGSTDVKVITTRGTFGHYDHIGCNGCQHAMTLYT